MAVLCLGFPQRRAVFAFLIKPLVFLIKPLVNHT